MPLTSAQQAALSAAIDRLQNYYDGDNPYNPATNPGGLRQGGQVVNFEPALKDTATVMNYASILVADATAAATNSPKAVRVDSAQSFTEAERVQGRSNLAVAPRGTIVQITSPVVFVDIPLPTGFRLSEIMLAGVRPDTAGAQIGAIISLDGGSTFKQGAGLYSQTIDFAVGGNASGQASSGLVSNMDFASNVGVGALGYTGSGVIMHGSAQEYAALQMSGGHANNAGSIVERSTLSYYTAQGLANALRIYASTGNLISGAIAVRGVA